MPKHKKVSEDEKTIIRSMKNENKTYDEIAAATKRSSATIARVLGEKKTSKLQVAQQALKRANQPTKIKDMPSPEELRSKGRAVFAMLGLFESEKLLNDWKKNLSKI